MCSHSYEFCFVNGFCYIQILNFRSTVNNLSTRTLEPSNSQVRRQKTSGKKSHSNHCQIWYKNTWVFIAFSKMKSS